MIPVDTFGPSRVLDWSMSGGLTHANRIAALEREVTE
jgi:hypothetical protein